MTGIRGYSSGDGSDSALDHAVSISSAPLRSSLVAGIINMLAKGGT